VIGTTIQIVGDARNLNGERLPDMSTGNGNATLAAPGHYAEGLPLHADNASLSAFVHIVDDDKLVRELLGDLLRSMGYQVALYGSAEEFVKVELPDVPACLVLDVRLPGSSGLELQEYLTRVNILLPIILITGFGDIPMVVKAMKAGAIAFLTKPIRDQDLLDAVAAAIRTEIRRRNEAARLSELWERYALLTPRERQVITLVASGLMNKQIAHELSISEATVKAHRGCAARKLGEKSVVRLARIARVLGKGE
jgi:FixJ family two-component response regulator